MTGICGKTNTNYKFKEYHGGVTKSATVTVDQNTSTIYVDAVGGGSDLEERVETLEGQEASMHDEVTRQGLDIQDLQRRVTALEGYTDADTTEY